MSISAPLVHNIETTGRAALPSTFQAYRAGFDLLAWQSSGNMYYQVDLLLNTEYLSKFEQCRVSSWFARHVDTGEVKVFSAACRLRWCSLCSDARRGFVTHQVTEWIQRARHPKFLTVTLKHSDAPLAHQVTSLYKYFRNFRKTKYFRNSVPGGIWFFQIKRSKNTGQWHPHIHCVIEGNYMPQKKLSRMWRDITFGSTIVDIRPVRNLEKGAAEVARYASTPADLKSNSPDDYVEMFQSLHGRRSCGTWGTAKKVSLRQPKAEEVHKWQNIGSWSVMYAMQDTEPIAKKIIHAWLSNSPLDAGFTMAIEEALYAQVGVDTILEKPAPYLPGFYAPP